MGQQVRFTPFELYDARQITTISAILQDSQGFLWFGTSAGLHRYDGFSIVSYSVDSQRSSGLSGTGIRALGESPDGVLWVGTERGLDRLDLRTQTTRHFLHDPSDSTSLSEGSIRAIATLPDGGVWVGTDYGLNRVDPETGGIDRFRHETRNPGSLGDDEIRTLFVDREGTLWIGHDEGLDRLRAGHGRFEPIGRDPADGLTRVPRKVNAITEDSGGNIWAGTNDGLVRLDPKEGTAVLFEHDPGDPSSLLAPDVTSVVEDGEGRVWVGTGDGLDLLAPDGESFIHHVHRPGDPASLADDGVEALHVDRAGIVWIGTGGGGLCFQDPARSQFGVVRNVLEDSGHDWGWVRAIHRDRDGEVWLGVGGLVRWDPETQEQTMYRADADDRRALSGNHVRAIFEDSSGKLWVGTRDGRFGGFSRFDRDREEFQHYDRAPGDPRGAAPDEVRNIFEDDEGNLWLAGDGVTRFTPGTETFTRFRHDPENPNSLSSDDVRWVSPSRSGDLWVATFDGVNRLDPSTGRVERFQHDWDDPTSIVHDQVYMVVEDPTGTLWAGTRGGLDRLLPGAEGWSPLRRDGRPGDIVRCVVPGRPGEVWLATKTGLFRYEVDHDRFELFDVRDGLPNDAFPEGACHGTEDGEIVLGLKDAFITFKPEDITGDPIPPQVALTGLELLNESVTVGQAEDGRTILSEALPFTSSLALTHRDHVISFEFTALSFSNPERNQFAYMLEGLDEDWNEVGNRRYASYAMVPPGDYVFRVKASNGDGVWSTQEISLPIAISPPFTQAFWFRALCLLTLGLGVVSAHRVRIRFVRQQNLKLEREVDRKTRQLQRKTEELEEGKADLQETLDQLNDTKGELLVAARSAGMAEVATGVLHNIGNTLTSITTSAGLIRNTVLGSRVRGLEKAAALVREHRDDLAAFLTTDPRGVKLADYWSEVATTLNAENEDLVEASHRLNDKVQIITDVIQSQQRFARGDTMAEPLSLAEVVEESLEMTAGSIERHGIGIDWVGADVPNVLAPRSRLVHLLINLLKNAKESILERAPTQGTLAIRLRRDGGRGLLEVTDNGVGIEKEDLDKIFSHGFSTKPDGHGFGLHTCATTLSEVGGRIWAESGGPGTGASFFVSLPIHESSGTPAIPVESLS